MKIFKAKEDVSSTRALAFWDSVVEAINGKLWHVK